MNRSKIVNPETRAEVNKSLRATRRRIQDSIIGRARCGRDSHTIPLDSIIGVANRAGVTVDEAGGVDYIISRLQKPFVRAGFKTCVESGVGLVVSWSEEVQP
jgi:hypothetical protein